MAEKKTETPKDPNAYLKEKVPFYAFRHNERYKDDITVGVNGKIYRIKRGVQLMIPRYVYNVLMNSMEQDTHTADLIAAETTAYEAKTKALQ